MQATEFFTKVRNLFPKAFRAELRDEVLTQLEEFSDVQRADGMRRLRQTKLGKQSVTMADVRQAIEGKPLAKVVTTPAGKADFSYGAAFLVWLRPSKTDVERWDVYKRMESHDQSRICRLAACTMMERPDWIERMEQIGGAGTERERFERMAAHACKQPCCDTISVGGWFPGRPLIEVNDDDPLPSNVPQGELAIRKEMADQAAKLGHRPVWGDNKSITHNPWDDKHKQPPPVSQDGASDALKALVERKRGRTS